MLVSSIFHPFKFFLLLTSKPFINKQPEVYIIEYVKPIIDFAMNLKRQNIRPGTYTYFKRLYEKFRDFVQFKDYPYFYNKNDLRQWKLDCKNNRLELIESAYYELKTLGFI